MPSFICLSTPEKLHNNGPGPLSSISLPDRIQPDPSLKPAFGCYAKKCTHSRDNTDLGGMETSLILKQHYFRMPLLMPLKISLEEYQVTPGLV